MKIGIYGGAFNPPHLGHLAAARAAADALGLDKLVFVPTGAPPHKDLPWDMPQPSQRLEMVELAADQLLRPELTQVWAVELERPGKSYTSDTLKCARKQWPEDELWLLVGSDMFFTLQDWHQPEKVMEMAKICAFGRAASDTRTRLDAQAEFLEERFGARVAIIDVPGLVEISSSRLREGLILGEGRQQLPPAVYGYILREKLYGTRADLFRLNKEDLRCVSWSMVKARRLAHIRGTEETAAKLAVRWGADEEKLRRAAILHDCTKYLTMEEHLALCDEYGVELDEMERVTEKLMHAKTGAVKARYMFGEDDEVYNAIFYHTTARANMSLAEKIIYIADYIEPNRDFPEVEVLRALAFEDLDEAMAMGTLLSIQEMRERDRAIHHNTLEAYEYYRKG